MKHLCKNSRKIRGMRYKFDPMDFETITQRFKLRLVSGINLILWILKQTRTEVLREKGIEYKFDPMDFETYNSVSDFEADIV